MERKMLKIKHYLLNIFFLSMTLIIVFILFNCGTTKISYVNDIKPSSPAWEPLGMTTDKEGNIYIVDRVFCVVHKFNNKYIYKGSIGEMGKPIGKLMVPLSITVDNYRKIWVSDFGNASLSCFDENGDIIWSRGGNLYKEGNSEPFETSESFPLIMPEGMTCDGNNIYIADSEANAIFRIKKDKSYERLAVSDNLLYPEDVCWTPIGLLITDTGNKRIILPDGSTKEIKKDDGTTIIPHRVDSKNEKILILGKLNTNENLDKTRPILILIDNDYNTICEKTLDPEETGDAIFIDDSKIAVSYPKIHRVVIYSIID
ncbi:MAG: hypothetical protein ACUVWP_05670 [bacterium]